MNEPSIQVNGVYLNKAQAMAVRVAVTDFHTQCGDPVFSSELGPIANLYRSRLTEVLKVMLKT